MTILPELKYTREHEWVKVNGETATIGITDYAQGELGDIVFVELPKVGEKTEQSKPCGSIEAVKAVSDLFAPVSGEVIELNSELVSSPQTVNKDPYGNGWMLRIKLENPEELEQLLTSEEYEKLISD
jgi:glycine cleavage system H protein